MHTRMLHMAAVTDQDCDVIMTHGNEVLRVIYGVCLLGLRVTV